MSALSEMEELRDFVGDRYVTGSSFGALSVKKLLMAARGESELGFGGEASFWTTGESGYFSTYACVSFVRLFLRDLFFFFFFFGSSSLFC